MAGELLLKTSTHSKYLSYRKILFHRFFVGLLLFIVVSLVLTVVFNAYSGSVPRTDFHEPVSLARTNLEVIEVHNEWPSAGSRFKNCTYWDCLDVYRCGRGGHDKITIYIYPLKDYRSEGSPVSQFSKEFYVILDTIKHSRYYTANPEEACLLVPSVDTLNQQGFSSKHVSKVLHSLEHWNHGENHIIFNLLPGSPPNYNSVVDLDTEKAIIAGSGFDTWSYRYGFDISMPLYSSIASRIDNTQPEQKNFLIISSQLNIPPDYLAELQNIASSSNDLLLLDKCKMEDGSVHHLKRCEYTTGRIFDYPDILKEGMFCLVVRSKRLMQSILMDALASQCIPIIIADSIVMPFDSHVDWQRIALFVPEDNIKNLVKIVNLVSKERRGELYWQLRWVYEKYFQSIEKITLTTLEILNERVFPLAARMYEDWNMPEHLVSFS
ncbi:hypothetical protein O0L34_g5659 [Tuta absoluta]|nr:hypothetical protein O0L34_g5659 [Tuta absoluta]